MPSKLHISAKSLLKRLKTSHFVRDVAMVGGGIAAAQAIALAFMPFLTRLYGPEAFGIAAAFAAIVSIITPIATMGYANAIVMPESDEDAAAVARLSILCGLTIAPISLIVVHIGKPWLASWTGMEQTPYILYLIPVTLLVGAFLSVANQSAIRAHLFKAKARAYVESTLVTNISKLVGGILAPSGLLLIILTLIGQVTNFVMQMLRVPRSGVLKPSNWFGFNGVRTAAVSQRDFAIYRMPQSILNAVSVGLPTILLASMFGASSAGQYSLAVLVLAAPVVLLGQAVGEVFYPKITRAITAKSTHAPGLLIKVTLGLFVLGIIPFGAMFFFGNDVFSLIFGAEWELAGRYSQWISLWLLTTLVSGPSIAALPVLRLQRFLLIREIVSVGLRTAALYVGFKFYQSDIIAIALFSVAGVLLSFSIMLVAFKRIHSSSKE
ncbi:lipopolysaccharide biosynthesis protein [Psychrobacter frigidicola]|uniref:lipopolysaccharide biosynthesis protein n=1 Tax=Psychrobacter frigidicola TaxID=45611 RepID=UPI001917D19B|nr:oligosaccharide flippase family protein [Psychrobacter frigidicola]